MATVEEVARETVRLNREGKFEEAEKYWADDVVSIEAGGGDMGELKGKEAVRGKGDWWNSTFEVLESIVGGPYVNGDQFTVRYAMRTKNRATGEESAMDEIGLYTVKDGKIVEERFFYASA